MALPPKMIHARKIAMIEGLGFTAYDVPDGEFDETGFNVVGDRRPRGQLVLPSSNSILRTHIDWPDADTAERARSAVIEDFAESFGMTGEEWIAEQDRIVRATGSRS
jgi:hypothetical protein